jgi:hypothetical protein
MSETVEESRASLKKEGFNPQISFEYKPINLNSSNEIFDEYVPPEGDGKKTILSKEVLTLRAFQLGN